MASTYNFTIRAEDNDGAFADRDFSIVVKNTSVDRFMIIDANDAYTSPNMVTWTRRIGQGGSNVAYGGGKWLIQYGGLTSNTYRLSTDGINFTTHSVTLSGYSFSSVGEAPTWHNGYWWTTANVTNNYTFLVKSADGVNWSIVCRSPSGGGSGVTSGGKLTFDGTTVFMVKTNTNQNQYFWFDSASETQGADTSWNISTAPASVSAFWSSPIKINNIWTMIGRNGSALAAYYSPDRVTWYSGTSTSGSVNGMSFFPEIEYINGVLMTKSHSNISTASGAAQNTPLYSDDGRNWVQPTAPTFTDVHFNTRSVLVSAKGKTWFIVGQNQFYSTNHGRSWVSAAGTFPSGVLVVGFAVIK